MVLKQTKVWKAAGLDRVHARLLKCGGRTVIDVLHLVFQKSWELGRLPDAWKIAKVTPIPKVSRFSNIDVSDLRPISVLSVVSKVMERIVTNRLMTVVEEPGWLSDSQCGFRRRLSTLDNLSVLVDDVLKNWGERNLCGIP